MDWAFIYLMLVLKIPIAMLLYIVWWAIKSQPETPEPSADENGGGSKTRHRHPRKPFPRRPRRGPHGDPLPLPPPRTRRVVARARRIDHA